MHGYQSFGKSFYHQLDYLSKDFEVFAPDLKGFGQNADMLYPYSLDEYILEVKEYMHKNGLENPSVVAHSFGGRIVLKGVATKKLGFDKLVLTGCAGLKENLTLKKAVKRTAFKMLKPFFNKDSLKMCYSKDYLALTPVMRESFKLIVSEYLDCYLKDIPNKTLIIHGNKDKAVPLYLAKKLNLGIRNSTLSVYDGVGHFCFLQKPMKFSMEVKEFLLS